MAIQQPAEATGLSDRERAIAYFFVAVSCFACLDASAKAVVDANANLFGSVLPVGQVLWLRFAVNFAVLFVVLLAIQGPGFLFTRHPGVQLLRSGFMVGATLCNFLAIQYLRLDQTMAILFAAPLVVALLSGPLLGEWIGPRRLAAVMVGFAGVLIVTRPGTDGMHWAMLLSVGSTLCYSLYSISTRWLSGRDPVGATLFYAMIAGTVLFGPVAWQDWQMPVSTAQGIVMLLPGLFGAFGHYVLVLAHRMAPAPIIAPFMYSQILVMLTLGFVLFGDVPDFWTIVGGMVIVASGLYLLARERAQPSA